MKKLNRLIAIKKQLVGLAVRLERVEKQQNKLSKVNVHLLTDDRLTKHKAAAEKLLDRLAAIHALIDQCKKKRASIVSTFTQDEIALYKDRIEKACR